ncbi:MAG: 6-carboxytetrahydropterin synthase QueD [Deltaproteobacteria bacterium]|jgi:6-pyruvoyltetrahydropterin/6-carboxytetrahydropterin synthase|nr:6-carboxytetrahydropterin synthase QueD [Deltaproteobacteria bacterium]
MDEKTPKPLWILAVRADFSAAHALRHYQGKCEAVHGHNFAVEITVQGSKLTPDTGLLVDFKDLKTDLQTVLSGLDHQDLNRLPAFTRLNPSSENIAAHIYRELLPLMRARDVRLRSVSVSEKNAQTATYMEE